MPTRSTSGGSTSFTASTPPTVTPVGCSRSARFTGWSVSALAHSSTRSAPPRAIPKSSEPQFAHCPSASHTAHRTTPSCSRSTPPHTAHAAGSPQLRQTRATPYPGSGANRNPRLASFNAETSRGARPSTPGFTISTGGHARPAGVTSVASMTNASAE